MTRKNTFELTVRREDLLEVYDKQIAFNLFSREYVGRLVIIGICLLLGGLTLAGSFYNDKYVFYVILFAGGIGYCTYDLWSIYSTKKKATASIEDWIKEVQQFKTHVLSVNEEGIVYQRDQEKITYHFSNIVTFREEKHFSVRLLDSSDSLLLPKKSFADGQFEQFVHAVNLCIEERAKNKNARPWFNNTNFSSLSLTKFKSISSRETEQAVTLTDPVIIQSLVDSIKQIPSNGDMMVSWGPDAEYITLRFQSEAGDELIEVIQKKFKTPSTGFHSENEQETALYQTIQKLFKSVK